ncbi:hypothetical protein HYX58_05105 [Candidatus Dependentiae bacterium]|nr:hypothetical protein [Candidatus Dependentiae bacterium]
MKLKNIAFFALSLLVVVPVAQASLGTTRVDGTIGRTTTYYGNRVYTNPTGYPTTANTGVTATAYPTTKVGTTAIGYTNPGTASLANPNYTNPNVYGTETNYATGTPEENNYYNRTYRQGRSGLGQYRHGGVLSNPSGRGFYR